MVNTEMQSMFTDFKVVNEPTITVEVEFKPDQLVADLAKCYMGELTRVAGPVGEAMLTGVDAESIRKYLCTLSWMRRVRAADAQNKASMPYKPLMRSVAVPVVWYQVLIGIGKAVDRDYSIMFVPGTSISGSDLIGPEEMLKISDIMFRLQNNGFKVVAGIPQSEEGELDFMTMSHIKETSLSYRQTHPVYGFLASFFATEEVSHALGALVRVTYGYDADYKVMLSRVVASVGGVGE